MDKIVYREENCVVAISWLALAVKTKFDTIYRVTVKKCFKKKLSML